MNSVTWRNQKLSDNTGERTSGRQHQSRHTHPAVSLDVTHVVAESMLTSIRMSELRGKNEVVWVRSAVRRLVGCNRRSQRVVALLALFQHYIRS